MPVLENERTEVKQLAADRSGRTIALRKCHEFSDEVRVAYLAKRHCPKGENIGPIGD